MGGGEGEEVCLTESEVVRFRSRIKETNEFYTILFIQAKEKKHRKSKIVLKTLINTSPL